MKLLDADTLHVTEMHNDPFFPPWETAHLPLP